MMGERDKHYADLHRHLDGSIFPNDFATLAEQLDAPISAWDEPTIRSETTIQEPGNLTDFLRCFEPIYTLLQAPSILRDAARRFCRQLADEGVVYAEPRLAPLLLTNDRQSQRDVVWATLQGLRDGENEYDVETGLVLCFMRGASDEANDATLDCALDEAGVVGVDLAGDESEHGIRPHEERLKQALRAGLGVTVHAGETGNVEEVRRALSLGVDRIGHGVALRQAPDLQQECRDQGVGVEQCLTSNLHTGIVPVLHEHPLPELISAGVPVTLNTDDPAISDITLQGEYERARQAFELSDETVASLKERAFEQAFCSI